MQTLVQFSTLLVCLSQLLLLTFAQDPLLQFNVKNNCPSAITLYIGGISHGSLAQGATVTQNLPPGTGFFYTDANGGSATGVGTTRAGFFSDSFYYYIVKDSNHFNTGLSLTPAHAATSDGFCPPIRCDTVSCSTAFSNPPIRFPAPVCEAPPAPPIYSCPFASVGYDIVFCPSGSFPTGNGQALHPNFNTNKCMDVRGAIFANGTPVQIYDCNGTNAQKWILARGSTKVRVAGTNFCLDAGSTPGNGVGMKIWQCYDNLPAQQWYYTDDNRVALEGKGLCLDLTDGILTNSNRLQTWTCTDFNTNQVWTT